MNDILMNIMTFINEHTLLLIGICVFLILVLVGYLIDNSVKSKRVRNDIKNKDQVPKNIKDEIIKEAEDKMVSKENLNIENQNQEQMQTIDLQSNQPSEVNENVAVVLDEPKQEPSDIKFENNSSLNSEYNEILGNNEVPEINDKTIDLSENATPIISDINTDPDASIMMPKVNLEYTNNKGLSEILFDTNYINNDVSSSNIFQKDDNNIVINNDVNKNDVQIESNNTNDELDRIMRKLSTMNNNVEDDNYTNIF